MPSPRLSAGRSWSCSSAGATSTAATASSRTGAHTRTWCRCHRRRCIAFSQPRGWFCPPAQRTPAPARPLPDWIEWKRHQIWIYDITHFPRAARVAYAILDVVTRKWLATHLTAEETATQVEVVFTDALDTEGLWPAVEARQADRARHSDDSDDGDEEPILLAMSDNGPQMRAGTTREFLALCSIAARFGRPGTPTDQAWIETLFGHIKTEWPHLEKITDPNTLRAELDIARHDYNTRRLHASLGYVTPDDEHQGRAERIRQARQDGLNRARLTRIAYHRNNKPCGGPKCGRVR